MWPHSALFDEALQASSRSWLTKVDVLYGGQFQTTLDVVLDGSVSLDDVAVRRQCSMNLIDRDGFYTPKEAKDLLSPKGTELHLSRGLRVGETSIDWVPLGVFGLSTPEVKAGDGGTTVSLKGHDRVDAVKLRRFSAPYALAKGTPTVEAIVAIVNSRLGCPTRVVPTGSTTPEIVFEALSDPWKAVQDLATADSIRVYFDPLGTLVVEPDDDEQTGITYELGESSLMLGSSRSMDSTGTFSGVVVTGEHPDETPIRVELWDTEPTSPTYFQGPFGMRPFGFASELLTTPAQALKAAQTILARVKRIPQTATLSTVGHIGHDIGDVIEVVDPRTLTSGLWRIVGGSVPLRPGPCSWKLEEAR